MRVLYSEKNLPHWKSALRPQTAELSLIPLSPKKDMKPTPTIHSVELEKFLKFSIHLHCLIPQNFVLEIIRQVTVIGLEATTCRHPGRRRRR